MTRVPSSDIFDTLLQGLPPGGLPLLLRALGLHARRVVRTYRHYYPSGEENFKCRHYYWILMIAALLWESLASRPTCQDSAVSSRKGPDHIINGT